MVGNGKEGLPIKTVVYIDELLLVNFAAGALFLLGAGLLAGQRCRGWRLILGASVAAASSLALLAPEQPLALSLLYKVCVCSGSVAAAYGWPGARPFGQLCVWCVLLSLTLTGAVLLPGVQARNLSVYLPLSPGLLLACTGAVYLTLRGVLLLFGRSRAQDFDAQLTLCGAEVPVRAFCDTGFLVSDPLSGRAVVLVRYPAVRQALPPPLRGYLDAALAAPAAGELPLPPPGLGVRLIPCSTVMGRCLLPAVPVQALTRRVRGRTWAQHDLLAAFCSAEEPPGCWSVLVGAEVAQKLGV